MKITKSLSISKALLDATLRRICDGVSDYGPITDKEAQNRIERVAFMVRKIAENPDTDTAALFKQLANGRNENSIADWYIAKRDQLLYEKVREVLDKHPEMLTRNPHKTH